MKPTNRIAKLLTTNTDHQQQSPRRRKSPTDQGSEQLLPPDQEHAFSTNEKASWNDKKDKQYVLKVLTSWVSYRGLFFLALAEDMRMLKGFLNAMPSQIAGNVDDYDGVNGDSLSVKEQILWLQQHIVDKPDDPDRKKRLAPCLERLRRAEEWREATLRDYQSAPEQDRWIRPLLDVYLELQGAVLDLEWEL